MTFSANQSLYKKKKNTSPANPAIKHWPAGYKGSSHLAGGVPYVTSPPYNQLVMALLPRTSPSYLPASQPQPVGPPVGITIRKQERLYVVTSTGYGCSNNEVCVREDRGISSARACALCLFARRHCGGLTFLWGRKTFHDVNREVLRRRR